MRPRSAARPSLLPLALLMLLGPLAGCGMTKLENQAKIQADLHEALRQAQINKTVEARRWADRAIAVDPKDINTYVATSPEAAQVGRLSIADVFQAVGDDPTLADYMQQAVRRFPDSYQPLQVLTEAQGRLGDTAAQKASAAALAALLEKKIVAPGATDQATLTNLLAQAYWDAGQPVKGADTYRKAIRVYPDSPLAYNGLAYAYAVADSKANLPEALSLAQKALQLAKRQQAPDSFIGAVQDTLGWVQYRQGDFKNALVNVQQGVNTNPRLAEGRYHLAMVYLALNRKDDARTEFTHATLLSKNYAAAQSELARLKAAPATQSG